MIFSINLDIELTDEELKWLKDKFLPNRRTYNVILGEMKESSYKENPIVKNLSEKNIIIIDSISNSNLTQIGHKILDLFDRDKKISDLLDGTNGIES
jgi:hypothetical protein